MLSFSNCVTLFGFCPPLGVDGITCLCVRACTSLFALLSGVCVARGRVVASVERGREQAESLLVRDGKELSFFGLGSKISNLILKMKRERYFFRKEVAERKKTKFLYPSLLYLFCLSA